MDTGPLIIANEIDLPEIWEIIEAAIHRRKMDGSSQWQDGYPNPDVLKKDILSKSGYILKDSNKVIAYTCIKINDEPSYDHIEGEWLRNGDFLVVHRLAVAAEYLGKGVATTILQRTEKIALQKKIGSIKVDTNFDNKPMLRIFEKLGYTYCGKVYMRGKTRLAYQKIIQG